MAASGNKNVQLYLSKAKGACTGLNANANGFVEAWNITWEIFSLKNKLSWRNWSQNLFFEKLIFRISMDFIVCFYCTFKSRSTKIYWN